MYGDIMCVWRHNVCLETFCRQTQCVSGHNVCRNLTHNVWLETHCVSGEAVCVRHYVSGDPMFVWRHNVRPNVCVWKHCDCGDTMRDWIHNVCLETLSASHAMCVWTPCVSGDSMCDWRHHLDTMCVWRHNVHLVEQCESGTCQTCVSEETICVWRTQCALYSFNAAVTPGAGKIV